MRIQHFEGYRSCLPPHLFVAHALSLPDAHIVWSDGGLVNTAEQTPGVGEPTEALSHVGSSIGHIGAY